MQFSKLRLNGFKSFVDPTELIIADGLTGLVGPNGCGKSNLLEALRWVMGETRPTSMRGGGMEDVIFNGTNSRPARNFAEVVLSIQAAAGLSLDGFDGIRSVDVARRITRDIGSAFRANGKEIRARDVRRLFADASTGAHSPALVRQGQIADLVNARPASRRQLLEEAAGIAGLHQRRHEAELKLGGAEANLEKVAEIIAQLEGQLASLDRQARQAARYREIGARLRRSEGLLLLRRWRDADNAHLAAQTAIAAATASVADAQARALAAAKEREAAQERLKSALSESAGATAVLDRFRLDYAGLADEEERARQSIRSLENQIRQLGQDLDRETALGSDAKTSLDRLDKEREALEVAIADHPEREETARTAVRTAAERLQSLESAHESLAGELAEIIARRHSADRRHAEARTVFERRADRVAETGDRLAELRSKLDESDGTIATARIRDTAARESVADSESHLAEASVRRADAQAAASDAWIAHSEFDGAVSALTAEVAALERVLESSKGEDGQIIDSVRVDPGHEAALGAAFGDELSRPMADPDSGREAGPLSGWVSLPDDPDPEPLPAGARTLESHVEAPPVLTRRIRQVGLVDADTGDRLQRVLRPGQRLVSPGGDMWRWDGYRTSAHDAPSRSAEHFRQINRLDDLRNSLAEAKVRMNDAAGVLAAANETLSAAGTEEAAARNRRKDADLEMIEASRSLANAEADRAMLAGKLEALALAEERLGEELAAAESDLTEADAALRESGDPDAKQADVDAAREQVSLARQDMISRRSRHEALTREAETRRQRIDEVARERDGWLRRQRAADRRIEDLRNRRQDAENRFAEAKTRPETIASRREQLAERIREAETRQSATADAQALAETATRKAEDRERTEERLAADARADLARAEAVVEAAAEQVEAVAARIRDDAGTEPADLAAELTIDLAAADDSLPEVSSLEADIIRFRRQRDALGAVNLRAEEDALRLAGERDSLAGERDDLEGAVAKLRSAITSLNRDGRDRLRRAFAEVNSNFGVLFEKLFGGGQARLEMVEGEDPLGAELDVFCQPPGKKLSTLSLLSGGEQTLTAIALVFAVFLVNPSPICVLDEVDAPLDDANVTRFCKLLDEMNRRTDTRFMIITHHAITMARMDRLFGVTMAEQGVSQLVSVDLRRAEDLAAS